MWNTFKELRSMASDVVAPKYVPPQGRDGEEVPRDRADDDDVDMHHQYATPHDGGDVHVTVRAPPNNAASLFFGDDDSDEENDGNTKNSNNDDSDDGMDATQLRIQDLTRRVEKQQAHITQYSQLFAALYDDLRAITNTQTSKNNNPSFASAAPELTAFMRQVRGSVCPAIKTVTGCQSWADAVNVFPSVQSTIQQREQQWVQTYQAAHDINTQITAQLSALTTALQRDCGVELGSPGQVMDVDAIVRQLNAKSALSAPLTTGIDDEEKRALEDAIETLTAELEKLQTTSSAAEAKQQIESLKSELEKTRQELDEANQALEILDQNETQQTHNTNADALAEKEAELSD
eukprot:PhM_4_TR8321/c0_g1_i1/m.21702